jgi:hypothetical protein
MNIIVVRLLSSFSPFVGIVGGTTGVPSLVVTSTDEKNSEHSVGDTRYVLQRSPR